MQANEQTVEQAPPITCTSCGQRVGQLKTAPATPQAATSAETRRPKTAHSGGFHVGAQCWTCGECGTFLKEGYQHSSTCSRNPDNIAASAAAPVEQSAPPKLYTKADCICPETMVDTNCPWCMQNDSKPAQSDAPPNAQAFADSFPDKFATLYELMEAYAALRTAKQDGRIAHLQEDFECEIGAKNREFKRAETAVAKVAQLESERDAAKLTCVELSIERTDETKRANTAEAALAILRNETENLVVHFRACDRRFCGSKEQSRRIALDAKDITCQLCRKKGNLV